VSGWLSGVVGGGADFPIDEAHGDEEGAYPGESFCPVGRVGLIDVMRFCDHIFPGLIFQCRCMVLCIGSMLGFLDHPTKVAAWVVEKQEMVGV